MGGMGARSIQGSGDETVADHRSGKANNVPAIALSWCSESVCSRPTRHLAASLTFIFNGLNLIVR